MVLEQSPWDNISSFNVLFVCSFVVRTRPQSNIQDHTRQNKATKALKKQDKTIKG